MYEQCLNEAERLLFLQKEKLMPVKDLWNSVKRLSSERGFKIPSAADFTALLEGDPRFDFFPEGVEEGTRSAEQAGGELEAEEMGALGFYPGDRVRLHVFSRQEEELEGMEDEPEAEEDELASVADTDLLESSLFDEDEIIRPKSVQKSAPARPPKPAEAKKPEEPAKSAEPKKTPQAKKAAAPKNSAPVRKAVKASAKTKPAPRKKAKPPTKRKTKR